jgi:hypothetical protein
MAYECVRGDCFFQRRPKIGTWSLHRFLFRILLGRKERRQRGWSPGNVVSAKRNKHESITVTSSRTIIFNTF